MTQRLSILLVCSTGSSTSILMQAMKKDLHENENWTIDATGITDVVNVIGKYDYILVAPQIGFRIQEIQELAEYFKGIKVISIPQEVYGKNDGKKLNDMIRNKAYPEQSKDKGGDKMSEEKTSKGFMDKLNDWMMNYLVPVSQKIGQQRHLAAVRDGLTVLIPVTIIGGFAILLAVPPVPATVTEPSNFWYAFLLGWKAWAGANSAVLMAPYYLTIGIISLYVVCGVSYELANHYHMNGINNMISSLLVFLCVSGAVDIANGTLNISRLGAGYMFGAMVIAILTVEVTRFFDVHNIKIKMPDSVPPNVAAPFNVLLALAFNVIVFSLINQLLVTSTGGGITDLIYTIFKPLMRASNTLPSILFLDFLASLFWFFGIHGQNMTGAIVTPITTAALAANAEAFAAGQPMPYIYAGAIMTVFGGWAAGNWAMNLDLLLFSKSKRIKNLAKVASGPAFFNIAEPYIFGLPEVLNLYTFIPGLITHLINITTYYLLASAGVVGRVYVTLPFTTPAPLQAFLATGGNVPTMVLCLILIGVDMIIWLPFLRILDNQALAEETTDAE